jgi:NADH:ubiquinone oxidoreductase subunit 5 (subunit L)/multisubunit Na+/H+ antiporter MnhA subunit
LRPEAWPQIQVAVLIYATHHALSKGSLFLGIGPAKEAGTGLQILLARVGLLMPALALAGAPFSSGALAKVALKSNIGFLPDGWAYVLGILLPLAAVGTTMKMARFLWLTWPRRPSTPGQCTWGMWAPWMSLVVSVPVSIWMLPGATDWLSDKLSPQKLWLSTWPLLVGGGLVALGAWVRRWVSHDVARWLPAGDMGVLLEKVLARAQQRFVRQSEPHLSDSSIGRNQGKEPHLPDRWTAVGKWLAGAELKLQSNPYPGAALLLAIGLLLWLLSSAAG